MADEETISRPSVWWFGVPTPGYTLIPPPVPLFAFGYVFGLGWMLDRQRALLDRLGSDWLPRPTIGLASDVGLPGDGRARGQRHAR